LVTDDILAFPGSRGIPLSPEERRRRLVRDAFSWAVVAIIHVVFFLTLVFSLQQVRQRGSSRTAIETILDLSLMHRNNAPEVTLIRPDQEKSNDRDISAKPLTVIPPMPVIPELEPAAPTKGDILNMVGQFLACGASSFEYLNSAQQIRCQRQPWQAVMLPNGSLVLNALPQVIIQTQPQFAGADALGRQMRTGSGCSMMVNMPCLDDLFSGQNSRAPGIPNPN
jgi:hypothetical protein